METLDLEDNWLKDAGCRHVCKMMLENDNIHDIVSEVIYMVYLVICHLYEI